MRHGHRYLTLLAAVFLLAVVTEASLGCATCFGDKDSPMTHGMNAGIFVLLGFIGAVLASFAAFFVYLWWRARNPIFESMELEPNR